MEKEYRVYNKLIRDKVPELMDANGEESEYYIFPEDADYENEVILKLQEETGEYLYSKDKEELADMLEVLMELARIRDIPFSEVEEMRKKKLETKGGFTKRLFLIRVREKNK